MLTFKYLPEIFAFLIMIMMATQSPAIGPYLVLAQFGIVGLLLLMQPKVFLEIAVRWWPVLLPPLVAVLSALWSTSPDLSARYGVLYLFTGLVGVLMARLVSPRRLLIICMLAMGAFLVLCVLDGTQGPSARGYVLVGLTGSKNQIGYVGYLLLLSALSVLLLRNVPRPLLWIAVLSLPLSLYILVQSRAATAVILAAMGAGIVLLLAFFQRFHPGGRLAALIGVLLVLAPLAALSPEIADGLDYFMIHTLDKDPTLTGRTELWAFADDLISRRPLLGYGYRVIWMDDSLETETLQHLTGQSGGQFNFHSTFRTVAVDTGLIGLTVFVGWLVAVGAALFRRAVLEPTVPMTFFTAIFLVMVVRAFTDVVVGTFSIHALILFAAATYAFARERAPDMALHGAPSQRPAALAGR